MSPALDVTIRSALWLLLGGWVGAWFLFAFVVARVAFRVLPSTQVAGALVSPVLTSLHLYGAVAGICLAGLALLLRRRTLLVILPLVLAVLCLYSQLGISAEMEAIHELAFGPGGSEVGAARFAELHRRSMLVFTAVGIGAIALVPLHVRADNAGSQRPGQGRNNSRFSGGFG